MPLRNYRCTYNKGIKIPWCKQECPFNSTQKKEKLPLPQYFVKNKITSTVIWGIRTEHSLPAIVTKYVTIKKINNVFTLSEAHKRLHLIAFVVQKLLSVIHCFKSNSLST